MILGVLLALLGVIVTGAAVIITLEKIISERDYKDAALVIIFALIPGIVTLIHGLDAIMRSF